MLLYIAVKIYFYISLNEVEHFCPFPFFYKVLIFVLKNVIFSVSPPLPTLRWQSFLLSVCCFSFELPDGDSVLTQAYLNFCNQIC